MENLKIEETQNKKVMIIYYSMYGHVEKLARAMLEGINSVEGVTGEIWQHEETLNENVLKAMHAPEKPKDIPVLTYDKHDNLLKADGFLFGMPTRFGMMSSQCKTFWDSTGKYWMQGAFVGKPAGLFFSTGTQGGGQETTALTAVTQLAHHGMVYVPIGWSFGAGMNDMKEVRGGSGYGTGTYAGPDGSRDVSELELKMATFQGVEFAKFTKRLGKKE